MSDRSPAQIRTAWPEEGRSERVDPMNQWELRWLASARRTKRCPECDRPARDGSLYCSVWCVDAAYRRERSPRRIAVIKPALRPAKQPLISEPVPSSHARIGAIGIGLRALVRNVAGTERIWPRLIELR